MSLATVERLPVEDAARHPNHDPLLSVEEVAVRLNVSRDWVWDHSSRKPPYLPVIRVSEGVLRYRASEIEEFVNERERLSVLRRRRR
jgi:predicted DNA-binding transcriptional regulator AlpA